MCCVSRETWLPGKPLVELSKARTSRFPFRQENDDASKALKRRRAAHQRRRQTTMHDGLCISHWLSVGAPKPLLMEVRNE